MALKSKRAFLEKPEQSGSYYFLEVTTEGEIWLNLNDCNRRISWYFGKPGDKRAVAKIKKVKALIDEVYRHLVPEEQR